MDRRQLEAAGAEYPLVHVQGLYAVPAGLLWFMIGLSNLEEQRVAGPILVAGFLLCLAGVAGAGLFYRRTYGRVTPTRERQVRYYVALASGFVVFIAADQLARTLLGRPPTVGVSSMASAWALGSIVFYAMSSGLRPHHVAIWGALLVAGLLPIWGTGVDRDAMAAFPIGIATILSGLLDHRLIAQTFRAYDSLQLERSDAGA
jgi:hypothetical protein